MNTFRHPAEPEMVFVQGGTFLMGATPEQGKSCDSDETPVHKVTLSSFYISKYPITQKQWKILMGTDLKQQRDKVNINYSIRGEGDNYPMYYISWDEAYEFINSLNDATGKKYRLPTEAEWEFACRGGLQSANYKYSGSNNINKVAWYKDNSGYTAHPVGKKKPNELGIYDMSGNVNELCSDWKGNYISEEQIDPTGNSQGFRRVNRGGSWYDIPSYSRVAHRYQDEQNTRYYDLGFRLVLTCEKIT